MRKVSILPADSYVVINKSLLNDTDRRTLTMLYEPLIGAIGLSLYFTLWAQLNRNEIMSNEYTHHHLIDCMGLKLDDIIASRKRLEAVGLLKTLFKMGDVNNYVYILFMAFLFYFFKFFRNIYFTFNKHVIYIYIFFNFPFRNIRQ